MNEKIQYCPNCQTAMFKHGKRATKGGHKRVWKCDRCGRCITGDYIYS
ncbi:MAG: hypothetical protein ACLFMM_00820 [Methanohalobium sp.]